MSFSLQKIITDIKLGNASSLHIYVKTALQENMMTTYPAHPHPHPPPKKRREKRLVSADYMQTPWFKGYILSFTIGKLCTHPEALEPQNSCD